MPSGIYNHGTAFLLEGVLVRKCYVCKAAKPMADYHKSKNRPNGHRYECKTCGLISQNKRYSANAPKYRAKVKDDNQCLKWRLFVEYSTGIPHCACCGEHRIQLLCLGHKYGGGNKHRKVVFNGKIGTGRDMYRWAKKNNFPQIFQVLCHNCNMAKSNNAECPAHAPHERCKEVGHSKF